MATRTDSAAYSFQDRKYSSELEGRPLFVTNEQIGGQNTGFRSQNSQKLDEKLRTQDFSLGMWGFDDWEQNLPEHLKNIVEKGCDESVDYFKDDELSREQHPGSLFTCDPTEEHTFVPSEIRFDQPVELSAPVDRNPVLIVINTNAPTLHRSERSKTAYALAKSLEVFDAKSKQQDTHVSGEEPENKLYYVNPKAKQSLSSKGEEPQVPWIQIKPSGSSQPTVQFADKENLWSNGQTGGAQNWSKESVMSPREHRALSEILEETSEWEGFKTSAQRMSTTKNPLSHRQSLAQILPARLSEVFEMERAEQPPLSQFLTTTAHVAPMSDLKVPTAANPSSRASVDKPRMNLLKSVVTEVLESGSSVDRQIKGYQTEIKSLFSSLEKRLQGIVACPSKKKPANLPKKPHLTKQPTEVQIPKSMIRRLDAHDERNSEFKRKSPGIEAVSAMQRGKETLKRVHSGRSKGNLRLASYFQSISIPEKPIYRDLVVSSRELRSSALKMAFPSLPIHSQRDFRPKLSDIWGGNQKSASHRSKGGVLTDPRQHFRSGNLNQSKLQDMSQLSEKSSIHDGNPGAGPSFQSFLAMNVKTPLKKKISLGDNPHGLNSHMGESEPYSATLDQARLSKLPKEISVSENSLTVYAVSFKKQQRLQTPLAADKSSVPRRTYSICSSRETSSQPLGQLRSIGRSKSPHGYIQISEPTINLGEIQSARTNQQARKLKEFLNLEADVKAFRKIKDMNSRPDSMSASSRIANTSTTGIRILPNVRTPDKVSLLRQEITPNSRCMFSGKSSQPAIQPAKKMTTAQLAGLTEEIYNQNHTENRVKYSRGGQYDHNPATPQTIKFSVKNIQAALLR